jgi:hypothetical protein
MVLRFCATPSCWHNSCQKTNVNHGSLSEMIFCGSPTKGNTQSLNSWVTSCTLTVSWHGIRITAFVQSWSVIVMIKSNPLEPGNLVIKSTAMV